MESKMWRSCLVAALVGVSLFLRVTPVWSQDRDEPGARLERLERRVNEMAERQEQLLRRLGAQMEHQRAMIPPGAENFRAPLPPPGVPARGPQNPHAARVAKGLHDALGLLFLIGIICNILLTIWIFTDIRKRGEGSGIFVALALVAGIPAAIIYSLVRLGDKKT
ncbi:MAG: hypothetical protein HY298_18150 [Verrucomicrobia bacterium]|nr:hypothetical protein [Verrucomicrobiota bacterium]